jgi:hypothetical protein
MDTRFWGPGAWKLLHTITYHSDADIDTIRDFFEVIPYILPCKYCRASLSEYYETEQLTFTNAGELQHWLYRIHNRVNGKLRAQGLVATRNPTYASVESLYKDVCIADQPFPAWDFLYSIAYNHPLKVVSTPMPAATATAATTDAELNRLNILPPRKRFAYWCKFWKLLPMVLPSRWALHWVAAAGKKTPCDLTGRRDAVSWVWHIRCKFDTTTNDPYRQVCSRLLSHSSGCSKSKRARTCRKKRT